jgi:hypothetical protein
MIIAWCVGVRVFAWALGLGGPWAGVRACLPSPSLHIIYQKTLMGAMIYLT